MSIQHRIILEKIYLTLRHSSVEPLLGELKGGLESAIEAHCTLKHVVSDSQNIHCTVKSDPLRLTQVRIYCNVFFCHLSRGVVIWS